MAEWDNSRTESVAVGTSSVKAADIASPSAKRTQIIIVNTSTTAKITLAKSGNAAVAGAGIVLNPSGTYAESTDGGYKCYQGMINAISDIAGGTIAVTETLE